VDECEFVWGQLRGRIVRQEDRRLPQHRGTRRGRYVWQVGDAGNRTNHLLDHLPATGIHVEQHDE
jgi:hypothetical protein